MSFITDYSVKLQSFHHVGEHSEQYYAFLQCRKEAGTQLTVSCPKMPLLCCAERCENLKCTFGSSRRQPWALAVAMVRELGLRRHIFDRRENALYHISSHFCEHQPDAPRNCCNMTLAATSNYPKARTAYNPLFYRL